MALTARYLIDKSAYARMPRDQVAARLEALIDAGEVTYCGIVLLEILFSARGARDLAETRVDMARSLTWIETTDADFARAADVMALLAAAGRHRDASLPDLLFAAVAERAGLTVLHYDQDYDAIASVTGQPSEWVVPQGSIP